MIPGAPLTNFNEGEGGGGSDRASYLIPKKITTLEFVYPRKSLLFFSIPKKSLSPFSATQKYPSIFFVRPKKIPVSFIDTKNHLCENVRPKKVTRLPPRPPPPSLKYVSGACPCFLFTLSLPRVSNDESLNSRCTC